MVHATRNQAIHFYCQAGLPNRIVRTIMADKGQEAFSLTSFLRD